MSSSTHMTPADSLAALVPEAPRVAEPGPPLALASDVAHALSFLGAVNVDAIPSATGTSASRDRWGSIFHKTPEPIAPRSTDGVRTATKRSPGVGSGARRCRGVAAGVRVAEVTSVNVAAYGSGWVKELTASSLRTFAM